MHKYSIGQTLYHLRWNNSCPEIHCFNVGSVKLNDKGYSYSVGVAGKPYIPEKDLCVSVKELIEYQINILKGLYNAYLQTI